MRLHSLSFDSVLKDHVYSERKVSLCLQSASRVEKLIIHVPISTLFIGLKYGRLRRKYGHKRAQEKQVMRNSLKG